MSQLYRVKAYLNHWLNVVDVHSVHSPFFYDFYSKVVKGTSENPYFESIEKMRENLLENHSEIQVDDLGAGSINGYGSKRKLSEITRTSLSPSDMVKLFYRICQYTGAKKIIELGTSVGLTSLYLSHLVNARIFTFEGSHALANVALTNFEYFDRRNILMVEGDIGSTLPEFLQSDTTKIGFAFLDANHRYAPTVQYFQWLMKRFNEKSIMVIDDIHHSEEMEKAWNELKKHDLVYGSIDLFRCGVLFFEPALNKQHFVWTL